MNITVVFHSIILISLLIFIGFFVSRDYKFNNDTKQLFISLIIKVAMPSIILSSIFKVKFDNEILLNLLIVFLISISINILGLVLGSFVSRILKINSKKIEITILSAFGNTGFIGIPLCAVLLGPEGALYAAFFDAGVDFTIWTVGVFIIQNNKTISLNTIKEIFNIPLIAIIIGMMIAIFDIHIPIIIKDLADSLAAFAVPLAMFYIGATLSTFKQFSKSIDYFEIAVPTIIKLIILPLIVIALVLILEIDSLISNVLIVQSMMPTLTLSSVLFSKYARDENFGALITIITTVLSLMTIPAILYLIN